MKNRRQSISMSSGWFAMLIVMFIAAYGHANQIFISMDNQGGQDCRLYTMNADGTGLTEFFAFPNSVDDLITDLKISPDGQRILMSSDYQSLWTFTGRNIFQLDTTTKTPRQLTPGPQSGVFGQPCPCGSIYGRVIGAYDSGYSGAIVWVEGVKQSAIADGNGNFRFDNVPVGVRIVTAYSPDASRYDYAFAAVGPGTESLLELRPGKSSTDKLSLQSPVQFGDRVYFKSGLWTISWLDINKTGDLRSDYTDVYNATEQSTCGAPMVEFDIAPQTGRLAVMDYVDSCSTNRGIYITDKDGQNKQLLIDFKLQNSPFSLFLSEELAWSPDETKIAFEASFNYSYWDANTTSSYGSVIVIADAATGAVPDTGRILPFNPGITPANTHILSWSPDSDALLVSVWTGSPKQSELISVPIDPNGNVNSQNARLLVQQAYISSATWSGFPGAPELTVQTTGQTLTLDWSAVSGATGYNVYYAPYPAASSIGQFDWGNQTRLSADLPSGSALYIAIRAYNARGEGAFSNIGHFVIP